MPKRRLLIKTSAAALVAGLGLGAVDGLQAQSSAATTTGGSTSSSPVSPALARIPDAQHSGTARMRFFGFDVYDASLWVAPGFRASHYAQHALVLELTYLRSLHGDSIAERSIQEMRRTQDLPQAQAQRWLASMRGAFPDVQAGDRITGLHEPAVGAHFWFNDQFRTAVPDPEFSRLFFGIWLSGSTSEPRLRNALLAGAVP